MPLAKRTSMPPSKHHHLADDEAGQVISWSSQVKWVSKDPRKHPYAAQMAATDCSKVAHDLGLRR